MTIRAAVGAHEIVGRVDELNAIDRVVGASPCRSGALVFEGGPGIGKTTLWREAAARAADRGWTVLTCRAVAAEAKLAFASLADLFEPVAGAVLPYLPEPQRLAFAVALLRATPDGAPPSPRAVAAAVLSALRRLAEEAPVALAIDDQQWLDRASAAALAFALRRIGDLRVVAIATMRVEHDDVRSDPVGLDAAFEDRLLRRRLGPLHTSALHHIVRLHLGHVFPRPTLRRIAETSGGNPFFALELARVLMSGAPPGPGEPLPIPNSLASLVAQRLAHLPADARRVLLFAAMAATPTVALLRSAAGADAADAALDMATQAQVVEIIDGRVRFAHPLLAATAHATAGPTTRREVHMRLASLVAPPEERARHLALATTRPDHSVARALDDAATLARRRGAPDAAAELQEQAIRLTPPEDRAGRRRRLTTAAEYLFHAGDLARARDVLGDVLADTPEGPDRSGALHLLGRIRGHEDDFGKARAHLEQAREECADRRRRAEIAIDLAYTNYGLADLPSALAVAREALAEAERLGDHGLVARALALSVMGEHAAGLGTDHARMDRALALEDPRGVDGQVMLRATAVAGILAVEAGRLAEGDTLLRATCTWAAERGEESGLALVISYLSWSAWWRGDLDAAAARADEVRTLSAQIGSAAGRAMAATYRGRARATAGDVAGAQADFREARALMEQVTYPAGAMLLYSSELMVAILLDEVRRVEPTLEPLVAVTQGVGISPFTGQAVGDAIEAAIRLDDPTRAAAWYEHFAERARPADYPWAHGIVARCASLLASARGDLDGALAHAEEAVRRSEPLGMPVDLGRALLTLGRVRRRRGERRLAREALGRALACFRDTGARGWAERAADELRRIPIRRAAGDGLTPTEERVAALAAQGKTNRQVATELFMSPKTVEANLARVYAKLGIASRAQLGARMAERRPARR